MVTKKYQVYDTPPTAVATPTELPAKPASRPFQPNSCTAAVAEDGLALLPS